MPYFLSPKVCSLIDSKSNEELERIYNHLIDLQYRLIFKRDSKFQLINRFLIHYINDVMYYRFCDDFELTYLAAEYAEGDFYEHFC